MNKRLLNKFKITIGFLMIIVVIAGCSVSGEGDKSGSSNYDGEKNYSVEVDYTITGNEPGAGITVTTEKVMESYKNLDGWTLKQSSTAAMMSKLDDAVSKEEPIIVTGWNPHWMFAKYDNLKYLDDPKKVYGVQKS
ncbi:glycine betaine ABC transporter substrate-binding protein [Virgibacillus sp. L01]|uniref:glycine betaine ABC transporter substrate-binding protein n=1 Tax=Virgibacillus sp. L01 TaxID=3457429 RepID=UPI003FD0FAE9